MERKMIKNIDKRLNIKYETDLGIILAEKKKIETEFKLLSQIKDNEEYERKSYLYYNKMDDLKNNKKYDMYIKSAIYALKAGYKFGIDDIEMGFFNVQERMPLVLSEESYIINKIHKDTGYLLSEDIDRVIIMQIFVFFYKKSIEEKGKKYIEIEINPFAFLDELEKSYFIEKVILNELSTTNT